MVLRLHQHNIVYTAATCHRIGKIVNETSYRVAESSQSFTESSCLVAESSCHRIGQLTNRPVPPVWDPGTRGSPRYIGCTGHIGVVLCDTWNRSDGNDTVSGIAILDTSVIPEMRYAISVFFRNRHSHTVVNHWNVCISSSLSTVCTLTRLWLVVYIA